MGARCDGTNIPLEFKKVRGAGSARHVDARKIGGLCAQASGGFDHKRDNPSERGVADIEGIPLFLLPLPQCRCRTWVDKGTTTACRPGRRVGPRDVDEVYQSVDTNVDVGEDLGTVFESETRGAVVHRARNVGPEGPFALVSFTLH